MGLGLYLAGDGATPGWLDAAHAWLRARFAEMIEAPAAVDARGALAIRLHPAAAPLELIDRGDGVAIASASTSAVGPGYHQWLCELLDALGETVDVAWRPRRDADFGDETGYFERRDRNQLERELLAWLGATMRAVAAKAAGGDTFNVCLPPGVHYEHTAAVNTPMGPRDLAWLRAAADDPWHGRDLFSWWDEGRGADFHHGRAVHRMWHEVRWRPPLDAREAALLDRVLLDLEAAHAIDPARIEVWPEWQELLVIAAGHRAPTAASFATQVARRAAASPARAPIGYLRRPLRAHGPGGWSIVIDGALCQTVDDDGAWLAFDDTRTVRLTAFASDPSRRPELTAARDGDETIDHADGELRSRLAIGREHATAEAAVPGSRVVCTLTWTDDDERDDAIASFRSLKHR